MKVCCCSLAGSEACRHCQGNSGTTGNAYTDSSVSYSGTTYVPIHYLRGDQDAKTETAATGRPETT